MNCTGSNQFGLWDGETLIHISRAERGLACQCLCLVCGEPLIARLGEERVHHFAHESNRSDCNASFESAIHRFAKEVILEARRLQVPGPKGPEGFEGKPRLLEFDRIELEASFGEIRPDLLCYYGVERYFIEIAYTHAVDLIKAHTIQALRIPALEIDLSGFTPANFDVDDVRTAILESLETKHWIYAPQPDLGQRRRFVIRGMYVSIREFPQFGFFTVWWPFNPEVNELLKPVLRRYGGRWSGTHRNWQVPDFNIRGVVSRLSELE